MVELAIVIPAYKATFLREALESIANQTDKRFHVYIGDDCSPSDIAGIVNEFSDRIDLTYKRFDSNLGGKDLVAQWERCIAMTKGEPYIWLFSDDDVMDSGCVEAFYNIPEAIRANNLVHFNLRVIDSQNLGHIAPATIYPQCLSAKEYVLLKLHGKIVSYVVEFIFPRKIYEEVNGFENFDLAWGADFMTWVKMASCSVNGIISIPSQSNTHINWRKSAENISPNNSHAFVIRKITSLIDNAAFLKRYVKSNRIKFDNLKPDFAITKFPIGEILRNCQILSFHEITQFIRLYIAKVGNCFWASISLLYIFMAKYIKNRK